MSNPLTQHVDHLNRSPVRCAAIVIGQWKHNVTGEITYDVYYNGAVVAGPTTLAACVEAIDKRLGLDYNTPAERADVLV